MDYRRLRLGLVLMTVLLHSFNIVTIMATGSNESSAQSGRKFLLVIWMNNGGHVALKTSELPVVEKKGDSLQVSSESSMMTIAIDSVEKITLEDAVVTANSYSREYGEANPVFEYVTEGAFLDGVPEIICEATDTSSVGTYDIIVKPGSVMNYNVNYVSGTLTITKAPLNIAAGTYTKKQGDAMPEFTLIYTGFKNADTKDSLLRQPEVTCDADETSAPGEYLVHLSGAEAKNYGIDYTDGKLVVTEADPVTITANSYSREYGDANPVFEYTSEGAALDGVPEIICEATDTSSVGTYDIFVKQGSVKNYNVKYVAETLTVTKALLTVSVCNYCREYGQENPESKLTYGGAKMEKMKVFY